ncbi:ATP-dependent nuclease [Sphaerobacter thermophilus]|uniref:Endonuclease GajA/Old nuclease/RecF-like AAA domain-containing protein n=1 Tax=Sphaerobacter thermophilus (strain ATCC 49802 / DSM 20745 / KCCM 41009 / NCIMB 13125 / S 6022) TaxID=479434 RepID=D1C6C9_SPHTD|nr:AAA family ATPase [Sphaerobacter thermophilus]ACZ37667.1 conserved hypothetical protein [Sphaerobacter thermophilus DSM 20745]
MRLTSFRVQYFRNIIDSTTVEVQPDITCLVGKNESGKSALLEALYMLNPAYPAAFDQSEHYPRWIWADDRKRGVVDAVVPITASFELEQDDLRAVEDRFGPEVLSGSTFEVSKTYSGAVVAKCHANEQAIVTNTLNRLNVGSATRKRLRSCHDFDALLTKLAQLSNVDDLSEEEKSDLRRIKEEISKVPGSGRTVHDAVADLLRHRMPLFFYFSEYSILEGRIDLADLAKSDNGHPNSSSKQTARALLKLAGTDLNALRDDNYEIRKAELEAVSNHLTRQVFQYWKQNRELSVNLDLDKVVRHGPKGSPVVARYLDVRVHDRRYGYTNNFGQRSSGFQWFFSFFAAFSEFEHSDEKVIVLLDEPALGLHGRAQHDFLRFIEERLAPKVQVLYTTHSPFMVQMGRLERVRIVEDKGADRGAVVSADVLGLDRDSLFPLQAAIGYDIAQSLFVGPDNLVVEGTSDFTYLTLISEHLRSQGRAGLDERWRILPAGGATNIPAFVALVGPHLDVTVVADSGAQGMQRLLEMAQRGLLEDQRLITIGSVTGSKYADIEDLFDPEDYLELVNGAFATTITLKDLPPGDRIVKRVEQALGRDFDHRLPADYLLRNRDKLCSKLRPATLDRFEQLFQRINETLM